MKPLEGKRMELAMLCRDSDDRVLERQPYGSEWTVGCGLRVVSVALPDWARQQLLGPSDKPRGKVASPSGLVL